MKTAARVRAIDHLAASGVVLDSADSLAKATIDKLSASTDAVEIDFADMPSVSSSFFNLLFRRVIDACGQDAIDRLVLITPSALLLQFFERSRQAVRQMA